MTVAAFRDDHDIDGRPALKVPFYVSIEGFRAATHVSGA
jgi:hypothetical protein